MSRMVRKHSRSQSQSRSSWFVWFVVVFGLLSAIALATYGIVKGGFGGDTHTAWLKIADELKQKGEPIYLSDMAPADVPAKQNFFAAGVFAGIEKDDPASRLLQLASTPIGGATVAELLGAATQGGGASLDAIATAMQQAGLLRTKTDFLLAGDRVRSGMRTLGLDFEPLNDAADRPDARFPIDYGQPYPPLPHLRHLEALGNWLAIRAIAQLSTNDADPASLDLLLIGRLADAIAKEPFPDSQRVRRQLLGLFAGCVRVGIDWGAWSDEQLARFGDTLAKAQLLTDFEWALRGERAQLNSTIHIALAGRKPGATEELQAWLGPDLAQLDMRTLRRRQVAINQAVQHFLDTLGAAPLDPASLVPAETGPLPESGREHLQTLAEDARVAAQIQTYLAQAETACALERYHMAHGAYPAELAELAPDWVAALPVDPLGRGPFAYRVADGGFVLAGAGWGEAAPWTWTRR